MADDDAKAPEGWLPVKEAAAVVGLHHGTLRSYVRAGKVPGRHQPGPDGQQRLYVPLADVQALARPARPASPPEGVGDALVRLVKRAEALLDRLDASERARHKAEAALERERAARLAAETEAQALRDQLAAARKRRQARS
jgi:predicted dehydrogenase